MGDRIFTVSDLEFRLVENKAPAFQVDDPRAQLRDIQIFCCFQRCDMPV